MQQERTGEQHSKAPVSLFRGMAQEELDAAYNNAAAVPDSKEWLDRWRYEGERIRRSRCDYPDLAYGTAERTRIDLYMAGPARRTLAFIHGGYWHLNSKEMFGFVAPGPLSVGVNVALIGYTLAPAATLDQIVQEIRLAIDWLRRNIARFGGSSRRITVGGWSAGGHLAAMVMAGGQTDRGLSISGIFDLEPIRLSYLNRVLALTPESARRNSPIRHIPRVGGHFTIATGGAELSELRRQGADFAFAWTSAGLSANHVEVPMKHHFAVLDELARPGGSLLQLLEE